ncbi:MAG TPA: Hpt domain-containing protein [Bryobacteraceae bacterium]|nr:Hpt domain-containing protein [Bryobacteraceae bacterium]
MNQDQPSSTKLFDQPTALARVGGDLELLREIAVLFREECPQALQHLREAIARGDGPAAGRVAHGLKGSTSNFGATPAVDAALKIEQLARDGRIEELHGQYETLDRALATLLSELQHI